MDPIVVRDLRHEWPQPKGPPVVAIEGASFCVQEGEAMGLLGPNGAGKTTMMQILATLLRPTRGSASIAGFDVVKQPLDVRRRLGFLSTTSGLPSHLTVRECLRVFADLHRLAGPARAVDEAVDRFRLGDFCGRFVEGLSTGMRQRLRIAAATIHRPPVLLLDEPTAGLDLLSTDALLDEIGSLRDNGTAVLSSTHRMTEAEALCDRVIVLFEGRILATGTVAGLREQLGQPSLAAVFRSLVRA
jgi:sodium transport system ATP-binding protein